MHIRSFLAWGARSDLAGQVAAVPYDVVDTTEARALAAGNPFSFLHVSRAEIDLPDGTDPYADAVYAKGRETFDLMQRQGVLIQPPAPQLYLYRQVMGTHTQHGIVACCATADYENRVIKTHEKTRQDKEDDRTRHIRILNAQTGPVFLTYRDTPALNALAQAATGTEPLFDFTAADGIRHTGWRFNNPAGVVAAFADVPVAYIADGHHRAAAAVRIARERRAARPATDNDAASDWFLGVLFPATEMQILPYNRCVRDLNGLTPSAFLDAVRSRFTVRDTRDPRPTAPCHIALYVATRWYELSWTPDPAASPEQQLDVSVLQDRLLRPILAIDDPRTSKRIEFVGGIRGTQELAARVDAGQAAAAFSMYPTTVAQLMAIADAGGIMPPKSTWFEPKLRDGLFIHTLD